RRRRRRDQLALDLLAQRPHRPGSHPARSGPAERELRPAAAARPHRAWLAGAGMLGLTWGLVRANTVGWGSAEVVLTLAVGAALVAGFVAWERRARSPMLPLALFRYRGFSTANARG